MYECYFYSFTHHNVLRYSVVYIHRYRPSHQFETRCIDRNKHERKIITFKKNYLNLSLDINITHNSFYYILVKQCFLYIVIYVLNCSIIVFIFSYRILSPGKMFFRKGFYILKFLKESNYHFVFFVIFTLEKPVQFCCITIFDSLWKLKNVPFRLIGTYRTISHLNLPSLSPYLYAPSILPIFYCFMFYCLVTYIC